MIRKCHKSKQLTVKKVQKQEGVFRDSVTTQSTFAAFKTHYGYTFTIPTSDNLLLWLGSVYWSASLTSTFSETGHLLMHRRFDFNVTCGQLFKTSCQVEHTYIIEYTWTVKEI